MIDLTKDRWWCYWRDYEHARTALLKTLCDRWQLDFGLALQEKGGTWIQFAKEFPVERSHLQRMLRGDHPVAVLDLLILCDLLDLSPAYFVPKPEDLREFFVQATFRLCGRQFSTKVTVEDARAYVSYLSANPNADNPPLDTDVLRELAKQIPEWDAERLVRAVNTVAARVEAALKQPQKGEDEGSNGTIQR